MNNNVKKCWSIEFKNKMITMWRTDYVYKLGIIPNKGDVISKFIPVMYDICLKEFQADAELHFTNNDGSIKSEKEAILLIYKRYKAWIEKPNLNAIKLGKVPPYNEISSQDKSIEVIDKILNINEPLLQIDDKSSTTEYVVTKAEALLNRYNVVFKFKKSDFIFSKWLTFTGIFEGFSEVQAYIKALESIYTDANIQKIKINNKSITITQLN